MYRVLDSFIHILFGLILPTVVLVKVTRTDECENDREEILQGRFFQFALWSFGLVKLH